MTDLLIALGLVLVIEGVLYALLPDAMRRMAARAALLPSETLRWGGLVAAGLGVATVWIVRG